ncbi:VTT domain-containing protein [Neobacillus niacini]|uniref:TVP38/TMEM64 family protein n=1 Tax=Neobacillus niacini TaxID=86668 RepID=UPI00052F98C8|nr:VTT domain-containing protein [Neobacillus niacini]KGM44874.1 alkaline phosphatase [Neobacillus niacini]MEC1521720.1 VTT domain-containing protein [Neobacillus niacini]
MNEDLSLLLIMMEAGGVFAPLAFVLFHLLRSFLFIPVSVVIIAGGVLFGTLWGTIYSVIGLMGVSVFFYVFIDRMPKTQERIIKIKNRWFGEYRNLTVGQIAILRLVPFVHYHLLSFCLKQRKPKFKEYMKASFLTNIPIALFFTIFGEYISTFTPSLIILILPGLTILVYLLREKQNVIKWREFFKRTKEKAAG